MIPAGSAYREMSHAERATRVAELRSQLAQLVPGDCFLARAKFQRLQAEIELFAYVMAGPSPASAVPELSGASVVVAKSAE